MRLNPGRLILITVFLSFFAGNSAAQICPPQYFSFTFRGTTFDSFSHAAFTPANELVAAGNLLDYNGAAHIAKYSKNGTPVWSNYYTIGYFTFYNPTFLSKVRVNDFVLTPDGGMVVAGSMLRYYNNRVNEIYSYMAFLAKIDKYGIVQWTRSYLPAGTYPDLGFSNILQTKNGDLIVYMGHDKGPSLENYSHCFNRVIRFSANGQLIWVSNLYTGMYDAGGKGLLFNRGLNQLADNNILVADAVYQTERSTGVFKMYDSRLHILSLDFATGKPVWESSYPYLLPATDPFYVPNIEDARQLPDGRISVSTSLYLTTPLSPALTKKPVTLIADSRGVVQKLVAVSSPSANPLRLTDVIDGPSAGTKKLLLADGNISIVATTDADGNIISSRGYNGTFPPNCMAESPRGTAIVMSNNQSLSYQLQLTDANGSIACTDIPVSLTAETISPVNPDPAAVVTAPDVYTQADYKNYFVDMEYPLKIKSEYPLQKTVDCEEPVVCCHDVVDNINIGNITLCEGRTYTLPDNTIIKDSGTYYVIYKTVAGCDSLTYTKVKLDKSLAALTLGEDTCLTGQSRITLRATPGYTSYSWMGASPAVYDTFRVSSAGVYRVRVTNSCGSKTDSLEVFDRCDFPVYLPTAFTPNRDFLNDDFGVPLQNKNRLVSLRIYNRWGEIVFETNSVHKRWDGTFKNQVLKTDIFVYYLEMRGLSGNLITQKGKLMLIR